MEQTPREVTLSLIDDATEMVGHHYRVYALGLTGALARAMDHPISNSPIVKHSFETSANHLQVALVSALTGLFRDTLAKLKNRALEQVNKPLIKEDLDTLDEHIRDAESSAIARLIWVAMNDATTGRKALRQFMFDVDTRVSHGMTRMGAIQTLRAGRVGNLKFVHPDRAGKLWHSLAYVTTTTRSAFLQTHVESHLYAISRLPQDIAKVEHNLDHKHHGMTFSISGLSTEFPSYDSIRDEVFHPHSRALVSHG